MIVLMLMLMKTYAQQKPYHTQYILNNYILNPALSGIENYTDVKLSYRNQWTGIDGAPVTIYASAHAPIGKKIIALQQHHLKCPGKIPAERLIGKIIQHPSPIMV